MNDRYHPWLAAVLALVVAGLGHAYLRKWGRAALWFGMILGGGVVLTMLYGESGGQAPMNLPRRVVYPVVILFGLSAVDAFLLGRGQLEQTREPADQTTPPTATSPGETVSGSESESVPLAEPGDGSIEPPAREAGPETETAESIECPNCGKETDVDIDFCKWCTEPLPWADER